MVSYTTQNGEEFLRGYLHLDWVGFGITREKCTCLPLSTDYVDDHKPSKLVILLDSKFRNVHRYMYWWKKSIIILLLLVN